MMLKSFATALTIAVFFGCSGVTCAPLGFNTTVTVTCWKHADFAFTMNVYSYPRNGKLVQIDNWPNSHRCRFQLPDFDSDAFTGTRKGFKYTLDYEIYHSCGTKCSLMEFKDLLAPFSHDSIKRTNEVTIALQNDKGLSHSSEICPWEEPNDGHGWHANIVKGENKYKCLN